MFRRNIIIRDYADNTGEETGSGESVSSRGALGFIVQAHAGDLVHCRIVVQGVWP